MALPKIAIPKFELELPSSKQKIHYRPFLVKEEKALLMALEGGEEQDINNAVIEVLSACIEEDIDVSSLPFFDVEYVFIQLRAKSVNNIINMNLRHGSDTDCQHVTEYELNLDKITVKFPKQHNKKIMINDDVGLVMKYPSLGDLKNVSLELSQNNVDVLFENISENIETVFDQEDVYDQFTKQELIEFLENLNKEQFTNIVEFYNNLPTVYYEIKYTCPECGKPESIPLRGLQSFFG